MVQALWESLKALQKAKPTSTHTLWTSNSTLRYLPKKNENICSHKNLYVNVDHGFSRDCQKRKKNQMCINWQRHELPLTQQQKEQIADDLLKEVGSKPAHWTIPSVQHSGGKVVAGTTATETELVVTSVWRWERGQLHGDMRTLFGSWKILCYVDFW